MSFYNFTKKCSAFEVCILLKDKWQNLKIQHQYITDRVHNNINHKWIMKTNIFMHFFLSSIQTGGGGVRIKQEKHMINV